MQRYFFHVRDGRTSLDEVGFECADMNEVRAQATRTTGETLRDLGPDFWQHGHWTMWVEDESGSTVLSLEITADLHGLQS
ncbi:hypothetical protein GRZ55_16145 [Chelativorans sp. ZYF759]|jgi:hypothetical protein|uniref:DUF6894 family protein n=1 Tax=Chelativorans sp. ZYF759 TaxID=2692213 RepID=UPI00145F31BC|nr:hypothetical protein [Chelativorans sp. ZYF759]NMG40778.1 hypothetical protein [Chelativorans sp. ZYF759]